MKPLYLIRNHEETDYPFLFATYLQNNWYDKTNSTILKKDMWMSLQHKRLEKVLESQPVKVACLQEDPDVILGYAFHDNDKPFVYVKLAWRSEKLNLKQALTNALGEEQK